VDVPTSLLPCECRPAPGLLPERRGWIVGIFVAGEIVLLECHDTSGPHMLDKLAQDSFVFRQMHQNESADKGIELAVRGEVAQVCGKNGDVSEAGGLRARPRHFEHVFAGVYPKHTARLANHLGDDQADLTGAAADVEHLHSCGDASLGKHPTGEWLV